MHVIPQGGGPKRGGPRQVPRSPPLKQTTGCWAPLKARQATLHSRVAKGGPRQVSLLPSLKHTTVYNPDNDLI